MFTMNAARLFSFVSAVALYLYAEYFFTYIPPGFIGTEGEFWMRELFDDRLGELILTGFVLLLCVGSFALRHSVSKPAWFLEIIAYWACAVFTLVTIIEFFETYNILLEGSWTPERPAYLHAIYYFPPSLLATFSVIYPLTRKPDYLDQQRAAISEPIFQNIFAAISGVVFFFLATFYFLVTASRKSSAILAEVPFGPIAINPSLATLSVGALAALILIRQVGVNVTYIIATVAAMIVVAFRPVMGNIMEPVLVYFTHGVFLLFLLMLNATSNSKWLLSIVYFVFSLISHPYNAEQFIVYDGCLSFDCLTAPLHSGYGLVPLVIGVILILLGVLTSGNTSIRVNRHSSVELYARNGRSILALLNISIIAIVIAMFLQDYAPLVYAAMILAVCVPRNMHQNFSHELNLHRDAESKRWKIFTEDGFKEIVSAGIHFVPTRLFVFGAPNTNNEIIVGTGSVGLALSAASAGSNLLRSLIQLGIVLASAGLAGLVYLLGRRVGYSVYAETTDGDNITILENSFYTDAKRLVEVLQS